MGLGRVRRPVFIVTGPKAATATAAAEVRDKAALLIRVAFCWQGGTLCYNFMKEPIRNLFMIQALF